MSAETREAWKAIKSALLPPGAERRSLSRDDYKPHVRKSRLNSDYWICDCVGSNVMGFADNPRGAFNDWVRKSRGGKV